MQISEETSVVVFFFPPFTWDLPNRPLLICCTFNGQILEKTDYTLISGNPFIKKSGKLSVLFFSVNMIC